MTNRIVARRPRGALDLPERREVPERRLVDAAYFPGGCADAFYLPSSEGEVAAILAAHDTVLAVGAQSSLTGGATPAGGALVAFDRFDRLTIDAQRRRARCGAGVVLSVLRDAAKVHGLFCAAAPTYDGATIGGMAATNAAGAATFKHGMMRSAVLALTVVLADGSVLDVVRGATTTARGGAFEVVRIDGSVATVPVPSYADPAVAKVSAGFAAARDGTLDLVDLFVGSEGTLGIVTEVEVALTPLEPVLTCWLPLASERRAMELTLALRDAAHAAWRSGGAAGIDVPAIEWFDARCAELLREDGLDAKHGVPLAPDVAAVLVFSVVCGGDDSPLDRLIVLLGDDADALSVALPGEDAKAARFAAMREAVPMAVNHRVRDARLRDPAVTKVAGDFCVPATQLGAALGVYREAFAARGLDVAIWGHASDGNVHPNVIPETAADVAAGKAALLEITETVLAMGGTPLSEHGVGRNPVKQEMLRRLRGDSGIAEMRATKRALDPQGKLAPGVLFPR